MAPSRVVPLSLAFVMTGCIFGTGFQLKSANPYEPNPVPPASGGGVGLAPVLAADSSVQRRVNGECYVPCLKGTVCNLETGMCDTLPCRGECRHGEWCDDTGLVDRCVPGIDPRLQIETKK